MAAHKYCYSMLTHPSMKDAINLHNYSTLKLAVLVAEFAQQMAAAHEHFSKEIQSVISSFRRRNYELKKERPVDTESTIFKTWEALLNVSEMDAQAHLDAASLLIKNVYQPLEAVAEHKRSQAQRICSFRENFETILHKSDTKVNVAQSCYREAYKTYIDSNNGVKELAKCELYTAHNDYCLQLRAANRLVEEFQLAVPQVLEELEEIYIDASNTVNVAIESLALLLLTKANEQHRRFDDLLCICRQVNPQLDISYFVKCIAQDIPTHQLSFHNFQPPDPNAELSILSMQNLLIFDRGTENSLKERRLVLQREGIGLASYMKQNQDTTNTLINVCQRNLANHHYAKVYETQEDLCRKRNEIRVASMQLSAIRAQIDMLTPKQNGTSDPDLEGEKQSSATIKGMWKKAFKNLKSNEKQNWLTKKGSLIRRNNSKEAEEIVTEETKVVDPVYSLLKCAADLPKSSSSKSSIASSSLNPSEKCSGHSSGSTSKGSSPSSSGGLDKVPGLSSDFKEYYKQTSPASHSPKTRRKKLNSRMKSFSLDTPDPPKQLLAIDENTKKKSSSFTNNCFGASGSSESSSSATTLRRKFGFGHRSCSLEIEEKIKGHGSHSPSPLQSPVSFYSKRWLEKSKKKDNTEYIVLYHFKGKEKDDLDLRAGCKVTVLDSSDPDWWKGRYNSKVGYFPATYLQRIIPGQKVFQVTHTMNLSEGFNGMRLHKDQIVVQCGDEENGMVHVRATSNKEAVCPKKFLNEISS